MNDVVIVGGGIVGLATALELLTQDPSLKLVILEKEPQVGAHQTSHNSGVIHSGLYYRPGSLKAHTCVAGAKLMRAFCETHDIPYEMCGKLVVATDPSELPALETLYQRGLANGVPGLILIGPEQIREIEPHARGLKALHVPSAGIVDYALVARTMANVVQERGGTIRRSSAVRCCIRRQGAWFLETTQGEVQATSVITCAGLQADRVARFTGGGRDLAIIPFRGEYYDVVPSRRFLVRGMVYPVPHPSLPFLGVHFTRTITGGLHAGPNAVLALKREGYRKVDMSVADTLDLVRFPGFWRMARRYWSVGMGELHRSFSKRAFARALQRLVPDICAEDLQPSGSGVRAQAVDLRGALVDDFNITQADHAIHIRNVPSPAATASLRIGQLIAQMAATSFGLGAPAGHARSIAEASS